MVEKRPNIVLMLSDDHGHDTLGVAGHPWIETPRLDQLASEGMRFTHAFVTTSLCAPSRASIMTGQYVRAHGLIENREDFDSSLTTFPALLSEAGYDTAYVGKWHLDYGDDRVPRGFSYRATYHQGHYFGCRFQVGGSEVRWERPEGWVDDVTTDYAIEFLRRERDRPFLLCVGFKGPHAPRQAPPRRAQDYADRTFSPPSNADALPPYPRRFEPDVLAESGVDVPNEDVPENWTDSLGDVERPAYVMDAEELQSEYVGYHQVLTALDDDVGRILSEIDALGLGDDTLVVYTSDNGYNFGAHGDIGKRSAYEESIRVPMIVRYPGRVPAGSVRDELALSVDLAPTFLDLAGVAPPASMHGRSLRPLLEGPADGAAPWRDAFVYEFHMPPLRLFAVRTESWKLVTYPGYPSWTQLFDLQLDPGETRNLAADPAQGDRVERLRVRLAELEEPLGPREP